MFSQFDNEEVETYFHRLNAQLKKMPPEDRAELHQELRQHLDALAAAHEELGATPEEAARAALRRFGDPKRLGRKMFQEWWQTVHSGERQVVPAILTVLLIHFVFIFAALVWWPKTHVLLDMTFAAPPVAGVTARLLFPTGGLKGVAIGYVFALSLVVFPAMGISVEDFLMSLLVGGVWMALGCGAAWLTGVIRRKRPSGGRGVDKPRAAGA